MNGATPMTISTIFESSPRPNTMNRIGSIAIGGIIEMTATKGAERRATSGSTPSASPKARPIERRDAEPEHEPLQAGRGVGPQQIVAGAPVGFERHASDGVGHLTDGGSSLSSGLAARRSAEPST